MIPAGNLHISGEKRRGEADVAEGAEAIMQAMSACAPVRDIRGEPGTHAGGMLERVRKVMASLTDHEMSAIYIQICWRWIRLFRARCRAGWPASAPWKMPSGWRRW